MWRKPLASEQDNLNQQRIMQDLRRSPLVAHMNAALLFGSYGNECGTADADIDVMLITAELTCKTFCKLNNRTYDLYALPAAIVRREIRKERWDNDNFILCGLNEGRILSDPTGALGELKVEADRIWHEGPSTPTASELAAMRYQIAKIEFVLDRVVKRNTESSSIEVGAASLLFDRVVGAYCKSHRLWRTCYKNLIRKSNDPSYEKLIDSITRYFSSHDVIERCKLGYDLAVLVDNKLNEGQS